jgi:hypothetical protein
MMFVCLLRIAAGKVVYQITYSTSSTTRSSQTTTACNQQAANGMRVIQKKIELHNNPWINCTGPDPWP